MKRRTLFGAVLLGAALCAADVGATELDLGVALGGAAPVTKVMRKAEFGFNFAGEFVYGPLPYFKFGARYSLGLFPQDAVDEQGRTLEPIVDHGIGGMLRLNLVGGRGVGWLEPDGTMRGSLYLETGFAFHMIGRENTFGFEAALAYELRPGATFYLTPFFRFVNDFGTSQGTASYVVIGLGGGYDFGRLIDREDEEEEAAAGGPTGPRTTTYDYPSTLVPGGTAPAPGTTTPAPGGWSPE